MGLRDHLHRLQPRVSADALDRPAGHAATHLHLSRGSRLGHVEHDHHGRRVCARLRHPALPHQRLRSASRRAAWRPTIRGTRRRSNGRRRRRRRPTISRSSPWSPVAIRCGRTQLEEGVGRVQCSIAALFLDHGKEALATTVLDAVPDVILKMPEDFALAVHRDARHVRRFRRRCSCKPGGSRRSRRWRLAVCSVLALARRGFGNAEDRMMAEMRRSPRSAGRQHRSPRQSAGGA